MSLTFNALKGRYVSKDGVAFELLQSEGQHCLSVTLRCEGGDVVMGIRWFESLVREGWYRREGAA